MTKDKSKPASPARRSAGSPDTLTKTPTVELSESDLASVTGGDGKTKTADKQHQQLMAYIKG
jgi:hypothetical protein